jgi:phosphinothricin tripeptide acetyl hydrolase
MPACAAVISPWADLSLSGATHKTRASRDPVIAKEGITQMATAYLSGADAKSPLASPVFANLKGLPPLLIQVGTEEVLYDDTTMLKARAEEAGVEVSAESWGGMIHVWHIFHPMLSEARDAIARMGGYIRGRIA